MPTCFWQGDVNLEENYEKKTKREVTSNYAFYG